MKSVPALFLLVACRAPVTPHAALEADALRADVEVLASDAFAGREVLTPGRAAAADWLVAQVAGTSLKPLPGEDDLRVPFALYRPRWDLAQFDVRVGDATFAPPDVAPLPFSGSGAADGAVVFAGFGHASDDPALDEYAGLDVTGRIVLAFAQGQPDSPKAFPGAFQLRAKAAWALEHGASALILMHDPTDPRDPDPPFLPDDMFLPAHEAGVPLITVLASKDVGAALLASDGRSPADLQSALGGGARPADLTVQAGRASLRATADPASVGLVGENVFAFLPGSDLADEWVVVGAHYDHVGERTDMGPGDFIYNGADDNASGSAVVLALARALASRPTPLRRSVVFAWFDAEEAGLLGSSTALVEGDLPADRVVAMLNLDMVGRNPSRPIQTFVAGFDMSPVWSAARAQRLKLVRKPAKDGQSDQVAFRAEGVPIIAFFTGRHAQYHTYEDEAELLDYARMERIASMSHELVVALADGAWSPTRRPETR